MRIKMFHDFLKDFQVKHSSEAEKRNFVFREFYLVHQFSRIDFLK